MKERSSIMLSIIEIFKQDNIKPTTELLFNDEFSLLVAIMLSAQTTDKAVNKATALLFNQAHSPREVVNLGEEKIATMIKNIGLYKRKAKNLLLMAKKIEEQHEGKIPHTREGLMQLAGVGRKTANVFLSIALNQPTIGIDTHIKRVSNRIGLVDSFNLLKIEESLMKITPKNQLPNVHQWLVLHGRYVCKAIKPHCSSCKIKDLCKYYKTNTVERNK